MPDRLTATQPRRPGPQAADTGGAAWVQVVWAPKNLIYLNADFHMYLWTGIARKGYQMNRFTDLRDKVFPMLRPYVKRIAIFGSFARGEETLKAILISWWN
jgi:hypothetical protein